MSLGSSASPLHRHGFRQIGTLDAHVRVEIWWNAELRLEALVLRLGSSAIVRGSKHYFVRSVSKDGETWAREMAQLHDYLEHHFPEMRLAFSFHRDITGRLAKKHIKAKQDAESPTASFPTARDLGDLQSELMELEEGQRSLALLAGMDSESSGILSGHLRREAAAGRRATLAAKKRLDGAKVRRQLFEELQRKYVRDGSAANLVFSICSEAHAAANDGEFADTVAAIIKELQDADRFHIRQKLGGRLNIQAVAARDPAWAWIEEWLGGSLTPRQLERLVGPITQIRDGAEERLMVTPDANIVVAGHVKEDQKLLAARAVSSLLRRADQPEDRDAPQQQIGPEHLPAVVGQVERNGRLAGPCRLPLSKLEHVAVSGSTGAGKSVFARVLIEEAAAHSIGVLVLDPRNQAAGLLVPEDRQEFLQLYSAFGLDVSQARAFPFAYYGPGDGLGARLPARLTDLAEGRNIVSFKGLDEEERCTLFATILDAAFEACAQEQAPTVRLLIIVEEAQLFTRRRVAPEVRHAGARAENALDRIIREGRKYGICVVVASQSIKDFSHDVASIRQNTNTKVFFRNADREVDYATDFLGDGRKIIGLRPGTCMIHNASLGVLAVRVRPPFSKLWEFGAEETRQILRPESRRAVASPPAQRLLEFIQQHYRQHQCGPNLSNLAELAGITSKRQLQELVAELVDLGVVTTKKLRQRGQPRVVEPIASEGSLRAPDESRTEAGRNP